MLKLRRLTRLINWNRQIQTSLFSSSCPLINKQKQDQEKEEEYSNEIKTTKLHKKLKTFRLIDLEGNSINEKECKSIDGEKLNKIFEMMIKVEETDSLLYMAQRQGKISFYMTSHGEEAAVVASAAALEMKDALFPQYREQGALMWRGYSLKQMLDQCTGNSHDPAKGRQMAVHYGSRQLNSFTVSSPLATQLPQASGAGYSYRIQNLDQIAATYFGEGTASEGDFHAALNFAATLSCQTLFMCRNNKYAISTPIKDQYRGDHIAGRAPSYGINTLRIDGNDALAVYKGVQYARDYIIKNQQPFFIEFITYRVGDHSTSDHSVLYRNQSELDQWKQQNNPINRLGLYLKKYRLRDMDQQYDLNLRKTYRNQAIQALKDSATVKYPSPRELFTDVYDIPTQNLKEQYSELKQHLNKYSQFYDLTNFEEDSQGL